MPESSVPPVDADVDVAGPTQRRGLRQHPAMVLAVIVCGGALGALARYGITAALPHPAGGMPWATLGINTSGCLLIGVVMVLIIEVRAGQRLLRPFIGAGVLGGYTTFSTYVVDIQHAIAAGAPATALAYLGGTVVAAMLAVLAGSAATRGVLRLARSSRRRP
ncbi:fluoride efflux transporter FluC [Bounagaea algeriensis]